MDMTVSLATSCSSSFSSTTAALLVSQQQQQQQQWRLVANGARCAQLSLMTSTSVCLCALTDRSSSDTLSAIEALCLTVFELSLWRRLSQLDQREVNSQSFAD